jgi:hypothetical protein
LDFEFWIGVRTPDHPALTPAFEIQNWNPKSEIENPKFQDPMLNTFVVHVENKPGVLTRVSSLFRRRAFNIDSLTVGRTEKPEVSRMTITVEADVDQARRIEANLYKL